MGIDESRSKNRHSSNARSTRRLSFRSLLCEQLERREVMDAAGIFDAGTDPAYFQRMSDQLRGLNFGNAGNNNQGGNGGGQNLLGGGGANGLNGGGFINRHHRLELLHDCFHLFDRLTFDCRSHHGCRALTD